MKPDREYFTKPGRRWRCRAADSLEMQDLRDAGANPNAAAVVAVRQLGTGGVRIRAVREIRAQLAETDVTAHQHARVVYRGDGPAGTRYGAQFLCMDIDDRATFRQMLFEGLLADTPTVREFEDGAVTLFYVEGPGWRASAKVLG